MAKSSSIHIAVPTKVSQPGDALDDLIPPLDDSFLDDLQPNEAVLDDLIPPLDDNFLDGLAADEAVLDALLPPLNTSALDELLGDDSILDEMFRPIDESMCGAPSQARRKKCRGGR